MHFVRKMYWREFRLVFDRIAEIASNNPLLSKFQHFVDRVKDYKKVENPEGEIVEAEIDYSQNTIVPLHDSRQRSRGFLANCSDPPPNLDIWDATTLSTASLHRSSGEEALRALSPVRPNNPL
jgi:hypothetical protein